MRFVKRVVFVLILLVIAFFIYRLISPKSAQGFLSDLKSFSNDKIGTHFSIEGESISSTGLLLDMTGIVLESDGTLQEITGGDQLFFDPSVLFEDEVAIDDTLGANGSGELATVLPSSVETSEPLDLVSPAPIVSPSTTVTPPSKGLSAKDRRDAQNILQGFGK